MTARGDQGVGNLTWYKGEQWPKVSCNGNKGLGYWSSGVAELRMRTRDKVATLKARSKDKRDKMGWGLSMRGTTKMGLVGMGVAVRDAMEVTLARISRGARGRGRLMRSGWKGKRPMMTGDTGCGQGMRHEWQQWTRGGCRQGEKQGMEHCQQYVAGTQQRQHRIRRHHRQGEGV